MENNDKRNDLERQLDAILMRKHGFKTLEELQTWKDSQKEEKEKQEKLRLERVANRRFVDPQGEDFTEYITTPEKEALFYKLCLAMLNCKRPLPECVQDVVNVLNWTNELKGLPKRASIQGNPKLN